jgi:hypothetical protein
MANVGSIDRIVRLIVGGLLVLAPFITGWPLWANPFVLWGTVVVGAVLAATSVLGFCPIYAALGLSSKRKT